MSDDDDEPCAFVFDHGSSCFRAGFAGECSPRLVTPPVIGRPLENPAEQSKPRMGLKDWYAGSDVQRNRYMLEMTSPIQRGIITDFDDMEKMWDNTFQRELECQPEEFPVLIAEPPNSAKKIREKITEIMFERFGTPGLYLANQATLALYASGRTTGAVVESGHGSTHVVPIFEGFAIPHATYRLEYAGSDISQFLVTRMNSNISREFGSSFSFDLSRADHRKLIHDVKVNACYVAGDYEVELEAAGYMFGANRIRKSYTLPDGRRFWIQKERFECTEALFQPSLVNMEAPGLHEIVDLCIKKCDQDVRNQLYNNVILSGGSTMFPHLPARLQKAVYILAPPLQEVAVHALLGRSEFVWTGGSILGSMSRFRQMWISKREYEERGPDIHLKCF